MNPTTELRRVLAITGLVLVVVGSVHLIVGAALHDVTGTGLEATDSDTRFAGGILIGTGTVWIYAARAEHVPLTLARLLAFGLLLGGLSRIISVLVTGYPGLVTVAQAAIEILVPLAVLGFAARVRADDSP